MRAFLLSVVLCVVQVAVAAFDPITWVTEQEKLRRADDGAPETLARVMPVIAQLPAEAKPFTDLYLLLVLGERYDFTGKGMDEAAPYDEWSWQLANKIRERYHARCLGHLDTYAQSLVVMPVDQWRGRFQVKGFKRLKRIGDVHLRQSMLAKLGELFDGDKAWYLAMIREATRRNDWESVVKIRIEAMRVLDVDPCKKTLPSESDWARFEARFSKAQVRRLGDRGCQLFVMSEENLQPVAKAWAQLFLAESLAGEVGSLDAIPYPIARTNGPTPAKGQEESLSHPGAEDALALVQAVQKDLPKEAAELSSFANEIIAGITARQCDYRAPTAWTSMTTLSIDYRNVESVTYLFFKSPAETLSRDGAFYTWTIPLPKRPAYQAGECEVTIPQDLPKGTYYLVESQDFGKEPLKASLCKRVTRSDLALVSLPNARIMVVNALSGKPIAGAALTYNGQQARFSNEMGLVDFADVITKGKSAAYAVAYQGDALTLSSWSSQLARKDLNRTQINATWFFDRGVYRAGQTIHYQVVMSERNHAQGHYATKPISSTLEIYQHTRNGRRTLDKRPIATTPFGDYAGSFTLPEDIQPGAVYFTCKGFSAQGHCQIAQYKRPNFELTLDNPTTPTWGKPVTLTGTVATYNKLPLADTTIKLTLSTDLHWGWWRMADPKASRAPITVSVKSDAQGRFSYTHTPQLPKHAQKNSYWPYFYSLTCRAKATDTTGETHTQSQSLYLATDDTTITLTADDWQTADTPLALDYTTNKPMTVRIYPASLAVEATIYEALGPRDQKPDNHPVDLLAALDQALPKPTAQFTGTQSGKEAIALPAGRWTIVALSGTYHTLLTREVLPHTAPYLTQAPLTLQHHDRKVFVGSQYPDAQIFVEVVTKKGIIRSGFQPAGYFEIPYDDTLLGGFSVHATLTYHGVTSTTSRTIDVPWQKELTIKAETLRETITPGQPETWTFTLSEPTPSALAVIYDASLDAITPYAWHRWHPFYAHYTYYHTQTTHPAQTTGWGRGFACAEVACMQDAPNAPLPEVRKMSSKNGGGSAAPAALRSNFAETALWLPQQRLADGRLQFTFTPPDSLTRWKLMVFAYDQSLKSGVLTKTVIARKPIQVTTNLPRYLYTGDTLQVPVKVTNTTDTTQVCQVSIRGYRSKMVRIAPNQSQTTTWTIQAPRAPGKLSLTMTATSAEYTDGEVRALPILTKLIPVQDRVPFTLFDKQPLTLTLPRIPADATDLTTSVAVHPDPVRSVQQVLPSLSKPDYPSSEQYLYSIFGLSLQLKQAPTQASLIQAREALITKLVALHNGKLWRWMEQSQTGSSASSAEIVITLARLKALGVKEPALTDCALKTLRHWDKQVIAHHQAYLAQKPTPYTDVPLAPYLYSRTAYADVLPITPALKEAIRFAVSGLDSETLSTQTRAYLAIACHRLAIAQPFVDDTLTLIRDAMRMSDTWGICWPKESNWWGWWSSPLESHVLNMEALLEIVNDKTSTQKALIWLFQHKRLNQWATHRATVAATWITTRLNPPPNQQALAINGQLLTTITDDQADTMPLPTDIDITQPITLQRPTDGLTFGGIYLDYTADASTLPTPGTAGTLSLKRTLHLVSNNQASKHPIDPATLKPGDRVRIRLTIRTPMPMETLRLSDNRPANFEPVIQTPHWGLGATWIPYDATSEAYIDTLPRGLSVYEYDCLINNTGTFTTAPATLQSLLAPEFTIRAPQCTK